MAAPPQLLVAALALGLLAPQGERRAGRTVPGPEAHDLLARARGTIVLDEPVGGITLVHLPRLELEMPRAPDSGLLSVHCVAGPDARGRIAFVANDVVAKEHGLELLGADGSAPETIFQARGDTLWEHAAGKHLALDGHGERVAFVARAESVQLRGARALLWEGELEVWHLASRRIVAARPGVLDDTLAWFPDGRHLAYSALIEPYEAAELLARHVRPDERFGGEARIWERVPAVHVLDVETGATRTLHLGERPLVSPDGARLLVRDSEQRWRLLELATDESRDFEAPGAIQPGPIAFVDPELVLYWAWPTEGSELRTSEHDRPCVGKKRMRALKLVDLRDGRFQTALPFVDPRRSVSFGRWTPDGG